MALGIAKKGFNQWQRNITKKRFAQEKMRNGHFSDWLL